MNITEWFDMTNKEHLQAYLHLVRCGMWPKGFIPEEMQFGSLWQATLILKTAIRYCEKYTTDSELSGKV